jgi:hypothetical protein
MRRAAALHPGSPSRLLLRGRAWPASAPLIGGTQRRLFLLLRLADFGFRLVM